MASLHQMKEKFFETKNILYNHKLVILTLIRLVFSLQCKFSISIKNRIKEGYLNSSLLD